MRADSKSLPQKKSALFSPGVFMGILFGATAVGVGTIVFFFNPSTHGFYPTCAFHSLTGLNCPGCGMTRSFYALLHGEFEVAMRDNALFVGMIFVLAVRGALFGVNKIRKRRNSEFFPAKFLWPLLAIALMFTVLRNLPAFAFLSP